MSKVSINESTLTSIGEAIRAKTGKSELIAPLDMPDEINAIQTGGGADLPEEAFNITGDCSYRFAYGGWDWFIKDYGNRVVTNNITNGTSMCRDVKSVSNIPFDLNFQKGINANVSNLFRNASNLKAVGVIRNLRPSNFQYVFAGCAAMIELPVFEDLDMGFLNQSTSSSAFMSYIFNGCYSLRHIPESFLLQIYSKNHGSTTPIYYYGFTDCYSLDEIKGLRGSLDTTSPVTSNLFSSTFSNCCRLKDILFATHEDGTAYTSSWKAQIIDLTTVGFLNSVTTETRITTFSNITMAKKVSDDATYQALKNDPDWYTLDYAYSRYNHDSAVNTINSLPDTSAYNAGKKANTIKFKGNAGSATDGGAINTLTEEEIAVAAAKGWTVSFA